LLNVLKRVIFIKQHFRRRKAGQWSWVKKTLLEPWNKFVTFENRGTKRKSTCL